MATTVDYSLIARISSASMNSLDLMNLTLGLIGFRNPIVREVFGYGIRDKHSKGRKEVDSL